MSTTRKVIRVAGQATGSLAKTLFRTTGKVIEHGFIWSTKDHYGVADRLARMPKMGLADTLSYLGSVLLFGIVGALVAGLTAFVLIAYVIPFVIQFLFL